MAPSLGHEVFFTLSFPAQRLGDLLTPMLLSYSQFERHKSLLPLRSFLESLKLSAVSCVLWLHLPFVLNSRHMATGFCLARKHDFIVLFTGRKWTCYLRGTVIWKEKEPNWKEGKSIQIQPFKLNGQCHCHTYTWKDVCRSLSPSISASMD